MSVFYLKATLVKVTDSFLDRKEIGGGGSVPRGIERSEFILFFNILSRKLGRFTGYARWVTASGAPTRFLSGLFFL